jgi:RNA polymerase sigma-70 factor (ECF subfamily)
LRDIEPELKALMLKGLSGDDAAHRAFLRAVTPHLRAFLRARLRARPEDAEDLLQDVLIALHTKRDMYDPAFPVTAWVYAIARHRLVDHWRKTGRRGAPVPLEDAENELFAEAEQEAATAGRDVARLLAQLPDKQRQAIQLVKLDELSVAEAAAQTGWSASDIKISVHRGLKKLAALMGQSHENG